MERRDHPRMVVIGAGIVGPAIAMHLAERDPRPRGPGPRRFLRQRPDGSVLLGERSQETVARDLSQAHGRAHVGSHLTDHSSLDADALPSLITELRKRGYGFTTIRQYT